MTQQPAPPSADQPSHTANVLRLSAFAAGVGGGNPAGVMLDAAGLTDAEMQRIATEVGYAETAFLVDPAIGAQSRHSRIRYFSPLAEVPFCGHATVATAVALAERRGVGPFTFETPVGSIVIETTLRPDGRQILASFTSVEPAVRDLEPAIADRLLALLDLDRSDLDEQWPLRESFAGNWHPIIAIRAQSVFDAFQFDPVHMRALMDAAGWTGTVTVVCRQRPDDAGRLVVESRNLFPVGDITEDPATGSAAASLGGYLRAIGAIAPPAQFVVRQGRHVERPSVLLVDVPSAGGITVTGTAEVIV